LHLALELFEQHNLDEIFFCPTSQSPHKMQHPPYASKEHRRAMTTAAIAPFPQFTLIDHELQQMDPCYTVDTIQSLIDMDGDRKVHYFLLLGEDAAVSLPQWKEVDLLTTLATPLVGSRAKDFFTPAKGFSPDLAKLLKKGWTPIPRLEISSSWIRQRIQEGKNASYLVPGKVWDHIQTQQLYRT
jgi:nicotinate-nucleotide adenylyltransferase